MTGASWRPCRIPALYYCAILLTAASVVLPIARADEPYAPSRDYELQDLRTHLWFDLARRQIHGEVTESVALLRDGVSELKFDSVDLQIRSVTVDSQAAKFTTTAKQLIVSLEHPAARGDRHKVFIQYEGRPQKGVYFISPDKNYPQQPKEIWTQGEAEDTRYYIPLYDYPNDRTTSEMILTVPATWITISNGELLGVKDEVDGTKTWDWKQSEPLSTYLLTAIAGEFVEKDEVWHGIPLRYVVPRGEESTIDPTFARTKEMLDLFSTKLGIPYPWAQYSQTSVNDFVAGGMENTSATTLTVGALVNPKLAPEERIGADVVDSHELAHQWFGDLVTCKDWANLWLNEGFATFFEHYWLEQHYGADEAAYEFWRDQSDWARQKELFSVPILTRDFDDSTEHEGNTYTKSGWVLKMLREKLGDDGFFLGLHHYLEANRGQNVVTADLQKAIEQATSVNVDEFFHQWVYRAGEPQFQVSYAYDPAVRQVKMDVKQTQKVEGLVGLFDVPIDVEIATSSGRATHTIEVTQADETFAFPVDGAPLMVIFDKGDQILKTLDFKEDAAPMLYQLKNGGSVPDRADAAVALGGVKNNPDVTAGLADVAQHDPFWGIRVEALRALGKIGGADAEKPVMAELGDDKPWVREIAARQLANFRDDPSVGIKLTQVAAADQAYRVRAAALISLGEIRAPGAFETLVAAVKSDSPDDTLSQAGLRGLGALGDSRAVPILFQWSAAGKPIVSRQVAISQIAGLDKKNKDITKALIAYLNEPYFDIRLAAIFAIGERDDPDAIAPLEELLKSGDLPSGIAPYVESSITLLKTQPPAK